MNATSLSSVDRRPPVAAIDPTQRVQLLDALRGAALFGVLLVNMLWFAGYDNPVAREQIALLPTAQLDQIAEEAIDQFVYAKAIGIFSFLFGVGFAMQVERWRRQGADSTRLYLRRLIALLVVGCIHWLAVWSGEILHVYALAGMLLLLVYRWRSAALVIVALPLAIVARPLLTRLPMLFDADAVNSVVYTADMYSVRLDVFLHGTFSDIARLQIREDCLPDFASGALLAGIVHALARFMLGVVVARGRYLEEAHLYTRQLLWITCFALPLGFVVQNDWLIVDWMQARHWVETSAGMKLVGHLFSSVGVVLMTVGYVALFAVAWQWPATQRLLRSLVPVGQMALTNYLLQTVINCSLFLGYGFGLMSRVGAFGCLILSTVVFLAQGLGSQWWMKRFRFGPAEWLWRWWTYQQRPNLVRA